jgi:hypothetical protein
MKRAVRSLAFLSLLILTAGLAQASSPIIQGQVFGVELCPQSICNAAIFTGVFQGRVGLNPFALGTTTVSVIHADLPSEGQFSAITGGSWDLQAGLRHFSGYIDYNALGLYNNGNNTYNVDAVLELTSGGTGSINFTGLLDHRVFPPTVKGRFF